MIDLSCSGVMKGPSPSSSEDNVADTRHLRLALLTLAVRERISES